MNPRLRRILWRIEDNGKRLALIAVGVCIYGLFIAFSLVTWTAGR